MVDFNSIKELVDNIKEPTEDTNTTHSAVVSRIDDQGTVWVYLAGSDKETPTAVASAEVKKGDSVNVEWRNNKLYIAGNYTNPSAGSNRVNNIENIANQAIQDASRASVAAESAEQSAESAQASAAEAKATTDEINAYADSVSKTVTQVLADGETAGAAAQQATEAANSALVGLSTVEDVVGVLNWITAHGTMTNTQDLVPPETDIDPSHVYFVQDDETPGDYHVGAHYYAIVSEPKRLDIASYYLLTVDESVQNYVATHLAVDSEGLWLIPEDDATIASSSKKILIAVGGAGHTYSTAGTYIIGKVNNVDTVLAKFLGTGAVIGQESGAHTIINSSGQKVYANDGMTQVVDLGYGPGKSQSGGTADAPYFTLGHRNVDGAIGNYSTAEGYNIIASGYASHAEGYTNPSYGARTVASGRGAHAEGHGTTASGDFSHAEGFGDEYAITEASGAYSHAEGRKTTASGAGAHAEGEETTASGRGAHAGGFKTIAQRRAQTVIGKCNITDTSGDYTDSFGEYAFIIGNGTNENARSNALTVDWLGNLITAGNITDGAGTSIADLLEVQNTYGTLLTLSSSMTLSTSAAKLPLNTFTGSGCSKSSNGIKVDKAGIYQVSGMAYLTTGFTANDIIHLQLRKNTTTIAEAVWRTYNAAPYQTLYTGPMIVSLAAGDIIYLYAYNQTGARGTAATKTDAGIVINRIA